MKVKQIVSTPLRCKPNGITVRLIAMARSQTIWLLMDKKNSGWCAEPVAAFTVKHEMITFLEHNHWQWDKLRLFKMPDNPPRTIGKPDYAVPEELDIREVMKL